MKYRVSIKVNVPYPKEVRYDQDASSAATAVARAMRSLRKDIPRKRLDEYIIHVLPLKGGL